MRSDLEKYLMRATDHATLSIVRLDPLAHFSAVFSSLFYFGLLYYRFFLLFPFYFAVRPPAAVRP